MTTQELNIANALVTAVEVVKEMLKNGFSEGVYVFKLSEMLQREYNISKADSIVIIEKSLELC